MHSWPAFIVSISLSLSVTTQTKGETFQLNPEANQCRAEHRTIDLHQHIDYTTQHLTRAVKIMDAAGVGIGVNLSGGIVTRGTNGEPSEFERNKTLGDRLFPGRFLHYMNLDYKGWDKPDFAEKAAKQIDEGSEEVTAAGKAAEEEVRSDQPAPVGRSGEVGARGRCVHGRVSSLSAAPRLRKLRIPITPIRMAPKSEKSAPERRFRVGSFGSGGSP